MKKISIIFTDWTGYGQCWIVKDQKDLEQKCPHNVQSWMDDEMRWYATGLKPKTEESSIIGPMTKAMMDTARQMAFLLDVSGATPDEKEKLLKSFSASNMRREYEGASLGVTIEVSDKLYEKLIENINAFNKCFEKPNFGKHSLDELRASYKMSREINEKMKNFIIPEEIMELMELGRNQEPSVDLIKYLNKIVDQKAENWKDASNIKKRITEIIVHELTNPKVEPKKSYEEDQKEKAEIKKARPYDRCKRSKGRSSK